MDSRLQLTDEQKQLVEQLKETIKKVHNSGVVIIADEDSDLFFFNGKEMSDWTWQENLCDGDYEMLIDNLDCVEVGAIRVNNEDTSLAIIFND